MKTLKKIFLGIAIILLVLLVIGFFLPKSYHLERSIFIKADKSIVYDLTRHLNKWDLWTPWTKEMDSTAVYALTGKDGEVGTSRNWNGKVIGNGQMTITQLVPGELVGYDLSFNKGKYQSTGKIIIESSGDSCKVSWTDDGNLGYNPVSRYTGLFMGKMMTPEFDKGLAKLKKISEERRDWPKIEEKMLPQQTVLIIRDSAGPKTYGDVFGKGFGEIMAYLKENKIKQSGPPFAIYLKYDTTTRFSVMDMGIPVDKADKGKGRVRVETVPAGNAVIAYYFGPYEKTGPAYNALHQYIREGGLEMRGGPWEIYVTDPTTEKDPMKVETDIEFPVK